MVDFDFEAASFFWMVLGALILGVIRAVMWIMRVNTDIKQTKVDMAKMREDTLRDIDEAKRQQAEMRDDIKTMLGMTTQLASEVNQRFNDVVHSLANRRRDDD